MEMEIFKKIVDMFESIKINNKLLIKYISILMKIKIYEGLTDDKPLDVGELF